MFEKLLKASDTLSPSVTKLLHQAGLPVGKSTLMICLRQNKNRIFFFAAEEKELLKLTNPDNIRVEASYRGPRMC